MPHAGEPSQIHIESITGKVLLIQFDSDATSPMPQPGRPPLDAGQRHGAGALSGVRTGTRGLIFLQHWG